MRAGDAVFGLTEWDRDGSLAEYTTIRASDLAAKPVGLDHVHTAALPLSALTAWQALHRHAHLRAMSLAEKTGKNYTSNLLAKLGLERRVQAAILATRLRDRAPAEPGGPARRPGPRCTRSSFPGR